MAKRILILTDRIGRDDADLGAVLMRHFLFSLARDENAPAAIMLANEGVRLACAGSESLDDLRMLEEAGAAIRACGTCLKALDLEESLVVGEVGAMIDMVAAVCGPDEIVTIA